MGSSTAPPLRMNPLTSVTRPVADAFLSEESFDGSTTIDASQHITATAYHVKFATQNPDSPFEAAAYPAVSTPALDVHLPLLVRRWYYNQESTIEVQNTEPVYTSVSINYYNWENAKHDAGARIAIENYTLAPFETKHISLASRTWDTENDNRWLGSARITADHPVAVVANLDIDRDGNGGSDAYESYRAAYTTGQPAYAPLIAKGYSGCNTGLQIQNASDNTNAITVMFDESNSYTHRDTSQSFTLHPRTATNIYGVPNVAAPWLGSARILADYPVAVVVGYSCANGDELYEGTWGNDRLTTLPFVANTTTWRAGIQVQNKSSEQITLEVVYHSENGGTEIIIETAYVDPYRSRNIYTSIPQSTGWVTLKGYDPATNQQTKDWTLTAMVNLERKDQSSGDRMMGYGASR
ncbi:MAG: hypothetical protein HY326_02845 [Chloroflexi bacterium]|nr:hypothetical protein [Chloroflexota bacterium]